MMVADYSRYIDIPMASERSCPAKCMVTEVGVQPGYLGTQLTSLFTHKFFLPTLSACRQHVRMHLHIWHAMYHYRVDTSQAVKYSLERCEYPDACTRLVGL